MLCSCYGLNLQFFRSLGILPAWKPDPYK
ncbi:unnamed protein product [Callosobruchus maculatus]|uniref:Uncharacterized protein n=1 Tax=Callosobruchus maculatus TaxID=64391 RepID=A0A653BZK1_CALMS|nr:unnamed protein product [Callosobruchus maculatus]